MKRAVTMIITGAMVLLAGQALAESVAFEDPKGDDKGPGNYEYPTDAVYTKGSFDLRKAEFEDDGDKIKVTVKVNAKIEDPWDSKAWDGRGFSVQMFFIYLDTDHKEGSGHTDSHPGTNLTFAGDQLPDKALIISAQGNRRVSSEISHKAKKWKKDTAVPTRVKVKGKQITAWFKKSDVGGGVNKAWGYQVVVQSNEGFPTKTDLLTRKVNEFKGQHRFGGGSDYDCDPHAMDILAGKGQGDDSEKQAQYSALGSFKCNADGSGSRAVVPMVYPSL